MDNEQPKNNLQLRREMRKFFRFPMEGEAVLFLQEAGASLRCGMMDLGLEGCRLRREEEISARVGMPVEVAFRLAGANFRFAGTLQWSARSRVLGVQFQKMSAARRQELADLLGHLREELEARESAAKAPTSEPDSPRKPEATRKRERREHMRHEVDGNARVRFLSLHARYVGRILDVSMGGCRIRLEVDVPIGAFRRVEVEFLVNGMPMLMPGVTQAIHDRHTVGIRFVEVTDRKMEQLRVVMTEIENRDAKQDKARA